MNILKFQEFINESNSLNESGIPLYRGSNFNPEKTIKRNMLLPELQNLLDQLRSGSISEVTVLGEVSTQGKNTPEYLRDLFKETGTEQEGETEDIEDDMYDPETGTWKKADYEEKQRNIFVDTEFILKDVDMVKGVVIGIPYSLRKKNIVVELDPETIDEVFIK
jgi:hypothetical protein